MKLVLKTPLFFLFTTLFLQAQNGIKNFIDQPYIEVTGTQELEITPDEIYLNIEFDETQYRGKTTIEKQEQLLITTLKSIGIDTDNNLTILNYDGLSLKKFFGKNEVFKTKKYELTVCDGTELNNVYNIANDINISSISILRVSHSEIEKLKRKTKIEALKTAKNKALDYATAINQKIGNALHIHENDLLTNSNYDPLISNSSHFYSEKENKVLSNPNFQKITLKASVSVKFKLI